MKTFNQQPTTQILAGGCDESAGSCDDFPAWQFTGMNVDPDAGAGCPINKTVTNVKLLPYRDYPAL